MVHRGARDGYQVARAMAERDLLEALVTDLHWPADRDWAKAMEGRIPRRATSALRCRWSDAQTSRRVSTAWLSGVYSLAMSKARHVPFDWQRRAIRWSDNCLGKRAGRLATARGAALLSYSYYGQSAFSNYSGNGPRVLFQLHPHPQKMRAILQQERDLHPECAGSLNKEWELSLPPEDFDRLAGEASLADHCIVASSFSKDTLVESGVPEDRIHLAPYGIDLERFRYCPERRVQTKGRRLRLLFVGTINQRKGIKYLLDAIAMFPAEFVELVVCGRPVDDLRLFRNFSGRVEVRPSVSAAELLDAYQTSDVFVFPSLGEGFGHVLLEAMACGLPVISTTRTAARDLVHDGIEGFLVSPGSATELGGSVEHFLQHPESVVQMGVAARRRAEEFTWPRFRLLVGNIMGGILNPPLPRVAGAYV